MKKLYCDLETFSPVPLKHGTHRYAESSEVMLWTWAADDGAARCWDRTTGARMPSELEDGIADERVIAVFQNGGMFDRVVLRYAMPEIYAQLPIERWYDTLVQALAHSLPGSLEKLCEIFKIADEDKKLATGRQLIQLFCVPPAKNLKRPRATRITHPDQWEQFKIYAIQDIPSMRAVHKKMPTWNYQGGEMLLWQLDQAINMRGMCVDTALAEAALRGVDRAQRGLAARTVELTDGAVQKATQRDQLLRYLVSSFGVDLPDMKKDTLERRINDPDLPWALRELLAIRLQSSTTSTSKYKTLLRSVSSDGRLRGTKQFNGASRTGRWAGRLFQPDNMPRPNMKQPEIEFAIEALKADCDDLVLPDVMRATSNAIRGCIVAPQGKKLVVADLSNIEGRTLAWLAGEEWKLQAFRDYDTVIGHDEKGKAIRKGHDMYKLAYSKSFGVAPEDVTDEQRQVGKVQELALGYEGGVGAFLTFAATYRLDLEDMADNAVDLIPADVWKEAGGMLKWTKSKRRSTFGLSDQAWMVCESFKRSWRDAHPATCAFWKDLSEAIKMAVARDKRDFPVQRLVVRREGAWLRIRLPSGRFLCYPSPRVDEGGQISYMGVNQYSRKWARIKSYGGKFVENCIAEGTEVLTIGGWRPIEKVADLPVWDGIEWVNQDGCVYKGKQVVLTAYGVEMTPDHHVLTVEGWKNASSCKRFDRADTGLPDGYQVHGIGEQAPIHVGSALPLRCCEVDGSVRVHQTTETRDSGVLRMYAARDDRNQEHYTWHEQAPGVCSVAQYERSLSTKNTSGLQKLWRAGDRSLQRLARIFREFLVGYGVFLPDGIHAGASTKQRGLQQVELFLEDATSAGEQSSHQRAAGHTYRTDYGQSGSPQIQHRPLDTGLENQERLAGAARIKRVYDLVNCGPRNRFVVRGTDGRPLIVHNCTQAVARDVMAHNMRRIDVDGDFNPNNVQIEQEGLCLDLA